MKKLTVFSCVIALAVVSAFISYRAGYDDGVRSERENKSEREFELAESRDSAVLSLAVLAHLESNDLARASTACVDTVGQFYHAFGPSTRPEWKDDIMYGDFLRRIEATAEHSPELRRRLNETKQ